jgi:hypothetical protein
MRKFYLLKNISVYSPTSPFFLLLSEHKHCDNAPPNLNSKNARSRMVASLRGSIGSGTREVKYWACLGCWISQCFGLFSPGTRFETYEQFISLIFKIFFCAAVNCGLTETADTESTTDMGRLPALLKLMFNTTLFLTLFFHCEWRA